MSGRDGAAGAGFGSTVAEIPMKNDGMAEFEDEGKYNGLNPNDVVFTPVLIAKRIVGMFQPSGRILEPCKGEGAFLKVLPSGTEWCEITEGKDFFDWIDRVDWIVTNPPYSNFNQFLIHSFEVADNVVFLTPIAKVFKSMEVLDIIRNYGGIKAVWFASARICGFPFGFPVGAFHFKRGWKGPTKIWIDPDPTEATSA